MRRRDLIAGLASVGVVAGGGILATRGPPTDEIVDGDGAGGTGDGGSSTGTNNSTTAGSGDASDSDDSDANAAADSTENGDGEEDEPIELETIDATGSEAGTITVPESGQVTFVDFFATWCAPCEKQMPAVAEAADRVSDDVRFLSVTNEPVGRTLSEDELREWWDDHDGNWLLGVDPTAELNVRYGVSGFPTAVVIDADNRTRWSHQGIASADELVAQIDAVLEGEGGNEDGDEDDTENEGDGST